MSWKVTKIVLRRNVTIGCQTFWKGEQADVVKTHPEGMVSVTIRGRAMKLSRQDYNVVDRVRINEGGGLNEVTDSQCGRSTEARSG